MPPWPLLVTLAAIGLVGSFVSGLLGIGGAVYIIPMLLYIPPLVGAGELDIRAAAGLSIVLVFVSALTSAIAHRKRSTACPQAGTVLAPATAAGALVGGVASGYVSGPVLTGLFATLALAAAIMMFLPGPRGGDEVQAGTIITFPVVPGILVAAIVGLFAGLVGAGGAFMLVPLMIYVLGIPTRVTVASSPMVVLISAMAGLTGKMFAGQVPWVMAAFLVSGAVPGARFGAWLSEQVRARTLRYGLGVITAAVAIKLWAELL